MAAAFHDELHAASLFDSNQQNAFPRLSDVRRQAEDDDEALHWAAIEKLPTYNRLRTGILKGIADNGRCVSEEVDVAKLGFAERQRVIEKVMRVADLDNEHFLSKLRDRLVKVGIQRPTIEVRFEHLTIQGDAYAGKRALPTLLNFSLNLIEGFLARINVLRTRKRKLTILNDVSGIVKHSRLTLLLGPPGSGKTTLLLALAGKLDQELRVSGQVTYSGHSFSEFVSQRTAAYISQEDQQIGEMTVRETLDFSGRCQGVGTRHEMLVELSRREKEAGIKPDPDIDIFMKAYAVEGQKTSIVTDYVMKVLGLDICADTMVGNAMRRGVSGGQKKRVTTGEMLVGPAKALFMDEISTGLDSSTTYQIVKYLRQFVHMVNGTMVVSLLQPPPETFEIFDDFILLSEGHIIYQGPRDLVLDFFEAMGFKCPERKSVADFLQEVTSKKDQEQYWVGNKDVYRYIPAKEFAEAFQSFHVAQGIQLELSIPFDKSTSHPAALSTKRYGLDKWELFKACFWREWLLMKRNSFLYIFKTTQISIVSLIAMTVFSRTKLHPGTLTDGNLYLGALFFGMINVMFNGFPELAMAVGRLPVFYKQRDQMFFPAWAASIPTFITRIPLSILESGIWVCLTYFVIGFAPEPARVFQQFLALFLISQMAYGLFRFIAAVGRSMIVASTFGSFALMILFVLGGFVISKDDIHKWWIWAYWLSPMTYGQNALAVNEFLAHRWNSPYNINGNDTTTIGKAVLKERGIPTEAYWYWIGMGALAGFVLLFNVLYTLALAYLNPLSRPQAIIPEDNFEEKQFREHSSHLKSSVQTFSIQGSTAGNKSQRRRSMSAAHSNRVDIDLEADDSNTEMALPFQPLAITFNNMNYYVDMPAEMKQLGVAEEKLQLLRGVSGVFRPGILTALVY